MSQQAPYSYVTFSALRQMVAARLYDQSMVFWTDAELKLYVVEALRTFNALANYWREDFTFIPQQNVTWYDLTSSAQCPNTLRPMTLTDQSLYPIIQYHLLEPVAWNPWTGQSTQFTAPDLLNAVARRRDELLATCAPTVTRRTVGAVNARITLPDSVIDIRRLAYLPAPNYQNLLASILWPEDAWGAESFSPYYTLNPPGSPIPPGDIGTPFFYLQSVQPPISFDTDRPPSFGGSYELLTIEAGPTPAISTPSALNVPDDWAWAVKWGALADLFGRESEAADPLRQQYCEQRYRMALATMDMAPALLALRMGNVAIPLDSVREVDLFATGWQNQQPGAPLNAYYAGLNLLALAPVPSMASYMATATVVENAPIPLADTDPVQVAREDLDAIVDYSTHIAMLKCGGAEFISTIPLLKRFIAQASLYNRKLAELAEFTGPLYALGSREKSMAPITTPAEGAA